MQAINPIPLMVTFLLLPYGDICSVLLWLQGFCMADESTLYILLSRKGRHC